MTDQQIEQIVKRGTIVLNRGGSFAEVQAALTQDAPKVDEVAIPVPGAPEPVVLTDDAKKALRRLPEVFAVVQPTERRALEATEVAAVYAERETLKAIVSLLAGRDENLKEIIRNHMDVVAEVSGEVTDETPVDDKGHYILAAPKQPERVAIPGTNQDWSREYRSGSQSTDPSVLERMLAEGEISRDAYLAMTREVRVFDPNKSMLSATTKPEYRAEIFQAIKAMTKFGRPGTSLFTRKAK